MCNEEREYWPYKCTYSIETSCTLDIDVHVVALQKIEWVGHYALVVNNDITNFDNLVWSLLLHFHILMACDICFILKQLWETFLHSFFPFMQGKYDFLLQGLWIMWVLTSLKRMGFEVSSGNSVDMTASTRSVVTSQQSGCKKMIKWIQDNPHFWYSTVYT